MCWGPAPTHEQSIIRVILNAMHSDLVPIIQLLLSGSRPQLICRVGQDTTAKPMSLSSLVGEPLQYSPA